MVKAPFTPEQVESINGYQESGYMHPFTCGRENCRWTLKAAEDALHCPNPECTYTQDWVHPFMADGSWKKQQEEVQKVLASSGFVESLEKGLTEFEQGNGTLCKDGDKL
jgi:hypothetical protein